MAGTSASLKGMHAVHADIGYAKFAKYVLNLMSVSRLDACFIEVLTIDYCVAHHGSVADSIVVRKSTGHGREGGQ